MTTALVATTACQKSSPSNPEHGPAHETPQTSSGGTDPISGTITVAPGLESAMGESDVLYIMARAIEGGQQGKLIAVKRSKLSKDQLPMRFELSASDVMTGAPFVGPFIVYARLDKDGSPMTKTAEDLYAFAEDPAPNGAKNLKLVLNKAAPPANTPASNSASHDAPAAHPASAPASQPAGTHTPPGNTAPTK